MKLRILALATVLASFVAGASGPEYHFWFDYGARPFYDPDKKSREIQLRLYRGSLVAQPRQKKTYSAGLAMLRQRLADITTSMQKQGRPFVFDEQSRGYRAQEVELEKKGNEFIAEFSLTRAQRFRWGKCNSNSVENVLLLIEQTAQLPNVGDNELRQLIDLRLQIYNGCARGELSGIKIDAELLTKPHFRYVAAIIELYQHKFALAIEHFEQIELQDTGWFGETASYLIARSYFVQAQRHWSGSSYDKQSIDKQVLQLARDKFAQYRQAYPTGQYFLSSKRITRNSYKLGKEYDKFQSTLTEDMLFVARKIAAKATFSEADIAELQGFIREFDLQVSDKRAGINGLVALLEEAKGEQPTSHTFYMFLGRLKKFKDAHDLYQQSEYQSAIDIIATVDSSTVELQTLLARSHLRLGQYKQSIAVWQQMKARLRPEVADTEIAKILFEQGGLAGLLNTPQTLDNEVFNLALARACSAEEVATVLPQVSNIDRRHWVVYDLAVRYLEADKITLLNQLFKTQPDSVLKALALIRTAVTMVATGSDPAKGHMNIAYFMENNIRRPAFSQYYINNYSPTGRPKDKCKQSYLTADTRDPYYYYQKALTFIDEASETEAKTLHFLVYCHKPQGVLKDCRWQKYVRNAQGRTKPLTNPSRQWFTTLHRKYKNSTWAAKTPYYYK
ncbi:MAG: hypothetical protein HRT35_18835 [Algicola sp.]|nr:hypothetical protein [Algicola sp.]